MLNFGGIIGAAYYTGIYSWNQAKNDIEKAEQTRLNFDLHFGEYLGIWFDTHDLIKEHDDLLKKAAEKLFQDKMLDDQYWEGVLLSPAYF